MGTATPAATVQIVDSTSGASVLKVDGTNGTLFEVVDDLSDSLMSVNDAAGLPVFEVFADNHIVAGRYNQNDFYLNTNGNLGLGTSSPITKLNIKGDQSADGQLYIEPTNDSEYAGLVIKTTRGADRAYAIFAGGTGTDDLNFRFRDASASADRMVIDSSGNVGIGDITDPDAQLDIRSASGSVGLTVGNTTGDTRLQITSTENSDVTFNVGDASGMGTGRVLIIKTGNSERMRIAADGKVGIGTASPLGKLDVLRVNSGALGLTARADRDGAKMNFGYINNNSLGEIGTTYNNGTGGMRLWIGGNLNSNSTSHVGPTQQGTSSSSWFSEYNTNNDYYQINRIAAGGGTSSSTLFYINSAGNVGIGGVTPTLGKLQVAGRGYFGPVGTGDATTKALMDTYSVLKLKPHDSNSTNMTFAQVNNGGGIGIQVTNGTSNRKLGYSIKSLWW